MQRVLNLFVPRIKKLFANIILIGEMSKLADNPVGEKTSHLGANRKLLKIFDPKKNEELSRKNNQESEYISFYETWKEFFIISLTNLGNLLKFFLVIAFRLILEVT